MSKDWPTDKELKKLFKQVAKRPGWTFRQRNNSHFVIEGPDGEKVFCSGTPSDTHAAKNIKRDLAKVGLDLD